MLGGRALRRSASKLALIVHHGDVGLHELARWQPDPVQPRPGQAKARPDDYGQLTILLGWCAKSLGIQYDWVGIAEDTLTALDHAQRRDYLMASVECSGTCSYWPSACSCS